MRFAYSLAMRTCRRNAARVAVLAALAALLALVIFGGSEMLLGLQGGLMRFQQRLGADVVVLPKDAAEAQAFEGVLVQGVPAHFYMEERYLTELRGMTGVAQAAPQFFLASAHAGCCSVAVQLIGFDPATDFTIRPWMQEIHAAPMDFGDILVGSGISVPADAVLTFYNTPCRVVGRLSPTGTGMDTAVYTNMETMRAMMANAASLDFDYFQGIPTENAISAVMIRTAEGFTPEGVAAAINESYPALSAKPAHGMVHHVEAGLGGILEIIGTLTVFVWAIAVIVLGIGFHLSARERRYEFLILRIAGATRSFLLRMMLTEAAVTSAAGGAMGIAVGAIVLLPFAGLMKEGLMRPYLLPDVGTIALLAVNTFMAAILSGMLSAAWTVGRVTRTPISEMLREDG
ncbi:ABC transporter permease [Selenomonas dianae]|uniref:Putative hemin transport system permease protein HrtB n=1 Tax=Selenomonas dianae TaxID=135079 RepID=A0ABN0SVP7_9FIRM|nr:ABC transporter permease [Selenomonas dianae]WLD82744.1 ABC transporter permease [Selenomonas dianae]